MDQKFFSVPFALSGDKTEIADDLDPAGFVNFTSGYPIDYQLDQATDPAAKAIERRRMNWLFNVMTDAIRQYQMYGIPEFITAENNGGSPFAYSKNAVVRYKNGDAWMVRRSTIDNNTSLPTSSPAWQDHDPIALIADEETAKAGISNTALMSPLRVKQVIDNTPAGLPVGSIITWSSMTVPEGYLLCDGKAVSRTVYADLFSVVTTIYGGGDGVNTFNLPDLRGVVVRGLSNGRSIDPGRAIGTYQDDKLGSHTHTVNDPGHAHAYSAFISPGYEGFNRGLGVGWRQSTTSNSQTGITINSAGDVETRMKNVALPIIIRWKK